MSKRNKIIVLSLLVLIGLLVLVVYLRHTNVAVLNPMGPIASQERSLIFTTAMLGMIVIVPVFGLTIWIAWKYRDTNHHPKRYSPNWNKSRLLETIWWVIPVAIITVLSFITWRSSYALDPFKPLASRIKPVTVQVIALDWKWLFLYPNQHVASVNQVQIPIGRPINFQLTSDSVMNSFWIPQLSGQIYAMPGMSTQLHLMADKVGSYYGSSANISGAGFAGMNFRAVAEQPSDFNHWVLSTQHSKDQLTVNSYNRLSKATRNNPVKYYDLPKTNLYNYILMKYMAPGSM